MTTYRSIAFGIFLTAILGVSAFPADGRAADGGSGRIYIINPGMFGDEKAGITKFIAGITALNKEFAKDQTDLKAMDERIQRLEPELRTSAAADHRRKDTDQ